MTIVFAGLSVGAVYALAALTFNIGLAQAGIFNIAQAELIVLATFIAYAGVATHGLPIPVVMVGGALICGFLAYVEERVAIRPLRADAAHGVLVTTVGFMAILEGIITLVWGTDAYSLPFFGPTDPIELFGGRVRPADLVILGTVLALALALHLLSAKTRWGLRGRAATEDPEAAALRRINVNANRAVALALAGALAGFLGVIVAPETGVVQGLGFRIVIYGFVALNLGGIGSYAGSLIGGLLVGLVDAIASRYLGNEMPAIVLMGLLLTVLMVRPSGLLGRRNARLV